MNVRLVPLLAAVLPFVAVHATYLVAASYGQVDWCLPYIDSCSSISATGRHPPASYLFRAMMLPSAVLMMAYWWFSHVWLSSLYQRAGRRPAKANDWMLLLGILAGLGLILYVTVLGEAGTVWARQRRVGTVLFFAFTYIAQLLLVAQLQRLRQQLPQLPWILTRFMWGFCALLLVLGLLTIALDAWNEEWYDSVENAFEWILTLLLQANFLLGYLVWRRVGWSLQVTST